MNWNHSISIRTMSSRKRKTITLLPFTYDVEPVFKRTRSQRLKRNKGMFDGFEHTGIPLHKVISCGQFLDFNKDVWECFGYVREEINRGGESYWAIYLHIIDNVKFRHTTLILPSRVMSVVGGEPPSPSSTDEEDEDPCPFRYTATYSGWCHQGIDEVH